MAWFKISLFRVYLNSLSPSSFEIEKYRGQGTENDHEDDWLLCFERVPDFFYGNVF